MGLPVAFVSLFGVSIAAVAIALGISEASCQAKADGSASRAYSRFKACNHYSSPDTRRGTFTKPVNLFPSPQQYLPQPAVTTSAPTICKVSILFNIHYLGVHQVHHPGFDLRGTVSVEREDDHVPSLPWSRKYGRIPKPWRVCRSGLAGFGLGTTFLSCWLQAVSMLGERCRTVEGNSSFLHNATPRPSPWITKGLEIGHSGDKRQQQTKMG